MTPSVLPSQDPYLFKPFAHSSHALISKILAARPGRLRILDAGAASGYMGRALREQGHYVAGLELDAARAKEADARYDAFVQADLEAFDFAGLESFDVILFADILEHLREPKAVLQKSLKALKPSGEVIISIPNVANIVVRLGLLFGRFDYVDRGPLDRGHLRFYTLKTFKEMVAGASCRIEELAVTPLPFQLALPFTQGALFAPFHAAVYGLTRLWKTLLAYQFVARVKPSRTS